MHLGVMAAVAVGTACEPRTAGQVRSFAPAALEPATPVRGPLTTWRVRVWVDQEYRLVPSWRAKIDRAFAGANEFLARAFAVELVAEVKPWNREGAPGDNPRVMIEQLRAHDPGNDVDWVVGYTGALARFQQYECLGGFTELLGKHVMLRYVDEHAYARHLEVALADRTQEQRETLIKSLREHLRVSFLLHEWAHTLGAIHDYAPGQLMRPEYSTDVNDFSPMNQQIIRVGLRIRRTEASDERGGLAEVLIGDLETGDWPTASVQERQALIERLRALH